MAHVIDVVKLDCVTIASFIRLFPANFVFHVVALVNCQCLFSMPPVPILLTTTTTVDEVKEQYLRVWKVRQMVTADKPYELYHDQLRLHAVTTSGRGSFFVTWTVEGLAPLVYARVTDPVSLPLRASSSSFTPSPAVPAPAPPPARSTAVPSTAHHHFLPLSSFSS
jgi:hypothetical protein